MSLTPFNDGSGPARAPVSARAVSARVCLCARPSLRPCVCAGPCLCARVCARVCELSGSSFKGFQSFKNFKGFNVLNADETDLRFLDLKNSICGLVAKGKAKTDFSGFVLDNQ